jgi:hypothetical protein
VLILRKPWDSQPQDYVEVDRDGIGRGMILAATASLGNSNLAGGASLAEVGTPTRSVGAGGIAWSNLTTANYLTWTPPSGLTAGTVLFVGQVNTLATSQTWGQYGSGGAGQFDWSPFSDDTIYAGAWSTTRVNSAVAVPGGASVMQRPHTIIGVGSTTNTTHRTWVNGTPLSAAVSGETFGYASPMRIGSHASGGYPGKIYLVGVWDRIISDSEVASLAANPWQLFAPRTIWVPVSAGGGGGGFQSAWARNANTLLQVA